MHPSRIIGITLITALIFTAAAFSMKRQLGGSPVASPTPTATPPATATATPIPTPTSTSTPTTLPTATGAPGMSIEQPQVLQVVSSPLSIKGVASGGAWFFEAQFPIKVLDGNGVLIGQSIAHAETEWTTNAPIPFTATLTFTQPATSNGTVVFENDNPSGLPENAKSFSVPVLFK